MSVVFVHGVPDTAEVWDPLRRELAQVETSAVALPGFGRPVPDGFDSTRWAYAEWLAEELAKLEGPIDVVAHDQGAVILHGVLQKRPDLVRSWVVSSGVCDDAFLWHRQARIWQTTRLGEAASEAWLSLPHDRRVAALEASGIPSPWAADAARHLDAQMLKSILPLYRSQPSFGDWAFDPSRTYPPGLVLWGKRDPFQGIEFGRRAAANARAEFAELDCGHWWQLERTREAASILDAFWKKVALAQRA